MRIANLSDRLVLLTSSGAVDVERASGGRFGSDPQAIYADWAAFEAWAKDAPGAGEPYDASALGAPVPRPRQVIAIGLNYSTHAAESGFKIPEEPVVFTKFPSCIAPPTCDVTLVPGGQNDWEVELVMVIGKPAHRVRADDAMSHVAGFMVGQDLSERVSQLAGPAPQFSLAKSFPKFGPTGPALVTLDELPNPMDLELGCSINGEVVQRGRTKDLIFSLPELVARLSSVLHLYPGDLIFTGTPSGVGMGRKPPRWLAAGDELVSWVEGVGELRQRFV